MDENVTRLSDNQRRFFCRFVFLFCCVLPTSSAIYFICHRPGTTHWEQLIQSSLPIKVDIGSVETPVPNQVVLRGLRILPSDTGLFQELYGFVADEVTIEYGLKQNEVRFIYPVEIEMKALANLMNRMVAELDESILSNERWQFSFRKVALVDSISGASDFLLKPMSLTLERGTSDDGANEGAVRARVLARTGDSEHDKPLIMEFQKTEKAGWSLLVKARQNSIPANLLRHFVDDVPLIGGSGQFLGEINLLSNHDGKTTGTVEGQISEVRLDKFQLGGGRLTGTCDIQQLYCQIIDGRIESSTMQVASNNPINVSRKFLEAAYKFGIDDRLDPQRDSYPISKLELGVMFQNGNVFLSGPRQRAPVDDSVQLVNCIAFQQLNGELVPVARCNVQRSIPIGDLAKMVTGHESNRTYEFLNCFNVSERIANGREITDGMY